MGTTHMLSRLIKALTGGSAKMSGSIPSPPPTYVYKILETARSNPRFLFPTPIPASHLFTLPPLDEKDGFVHLSTAKQLPGTLSRFFAEHSEVVLLKMEYKRLSAWKDVRWEGTSSGEAFPHLYGYGIEGEMVESYKELKRGEQGEKLDSWQDALKKLEQEGWLVYSHHRVSNDDWTRCPSTVAQQATNGSTGHADHDDTVSYLNIHGIHSASQTSTPLTMPLFPR